MDDKDSSFFSIRLDVGRRAKGRLTFVLGKAGGGGTGWKGPRGMEGFCSYFYRAWEQLGVTGSGWTGGCACVPSFSLSSSLPLRLLVSSLLSSSGAYHAYHTTSDYYPCCHAICHATCPFQRPDRFLSRPQLLSLTDRPHGGHDTLDSKFPLNTVY